MGIRFDSCKFVSHIQGVDTQGIVIWIEWNNKEVFAMRLIKLRKIE